MISVSVPVPVSVPVFVSLSIAVSAPVVLLVLSLVIIPSFSAEIITAKDKAMSEIVAVIVIKLIK